MIEKVLKLKVLPQRDNSHPHGITFRFDNPNIKTKEIVEQLIDNDITEKIRNITIDTRNSEIKNKKVQQLDEVDLAQMSLFDTVKDEDVIKL